MSTSSTEKFCLKWNDFESNISGAFRELRDEKDFFDVTLACGEDQIPAHKLILSACSPFFKKLLRRNPHQHPLLYLKGISFNDIQALLNFMYHGEANVAQDDLNSFLAVAEDLQVKGLTQGRSDNKPRRDSSIFNSLEPREKGTKKTPVLLSTKTPVAMEDDDIQEVVPIKQEVDTGGGGSHGQFSGDTQVATAEYEDDQYYDEEYDETFTSQDYAQASATGGKGTATPLSFDQLDTFIALNTTKLETGWMCNICGEAKNDHSNLKRHVEAKHCVLPPLECTLCTKVFKTKNSLQKHIGIYHKQM